MYLCEDDSLLFGLDNVIPLIAFNENKPCSRYHFYILG